MTKFSDSAILWQVFPLGALGAPDVNPELEGQTCSPERRLRDLIPWLDHAIRLGANAISLGPIFHSYSHGYDTVDYYRIDPRLGDMDDFKVLVEAAHGRGMKVILDGVFNHVGSRHEMLQSLADGGPDSKYADYLLPNWDSWEPGKLPEYHCFEGHTGLATLNHQNPDVQEMIADVMIHWLHEGADGWRLDAAYSMDPGVWQDILPKVREARPDAWIVAEVIHGDYVELVKASGWDSLTEYELWKSIWSSLNDANFFELEWTLKRHNEFMDAFLPQTFIGNHDVTRIASQLQNQENVGLAVAILMTTGGVPSIYYGDAIGFTGVKEERLGGDAAIRQPLPKTPELSMEDPRVGHFFHWFSSLSALRRQHPWLWHARTKVVEIENEVIRYVSYNPDGNEAVTVVLNASENLIPGGHKFIQGIGDNLIAGQWDEGGLRPHAYFIAEGACGSDLHA